MAIKDNSFDTQGNTLQEVAASAIVSGSFAFETTIAKFYSATDTAAGQPVAPDVGGCTINILKETLANTFAIGAEVFGDETLQTARLTPDSVSMLSSPRRPGGRSPQPTSGWASIIFSRASTICCSSSLCCYWCVAGSA